MFNKKTSSIQSFADPFKGSANVCVIGNGCSELPLCVLMKDCGYNVIGLDASAAAVSSDRQGKSTIDNVKDEQLQGIWFTMDAAETEDCDVFVISALASRNS